MTNRDQATAATLLRRWWEFEKRIEILSLNDVEGWDQMNRDHTTLMEDTESFITHEETPTDPIRRPR